jgi:protein TonB
VSAAISPPRITSSDRLGVTLFVAMAIHSLVILGVSFNRQDRDNRNAPPLTMEITLVQSRQKDAPQEAAYLAQANQAGGGDVKENVRPSSPVASPYTRDEKGDAASNRLATSPQQRPIEQRKVLTAEQSDLHVTKTPAPLQPPLPQSLESTDLMVRSREIARMEAELRDRQQQYAKMPRQKFISANTREYRFAAYEDAWRVKVENIGNINYPDEAKRKQLSGNLLLDVAINPDGTLHSVTVVRSSGHRALDEGAIRIVKLAEPFAKFPDDIRKDTDILHIIRTWQFQSDNRLRAY